MCDFSSVTEETLSNFLIGNSDAMAKLRSAIINASYWDFPVMIEGDTGTGKDLVANLVFHLWMERQERKGNIVAVDCGTLRGELLLSRLYGHKKGAFTGALSDFPGIFGDAQNGAIFFDELGNLGMDAQTLFLRALESKRFMPVGSTKEQKFVGRFIAATNSELKTMVKSGKFREDLFHRINNIQIHTPRLRDHLSDIPAIANAHLKQLQAQIQKATGHEDVSFHMDAFDSLMNYNWPGNVRELYAVIDRALVSMPRGTHVINQEHLHFEAEPSEILSLSSPFDSCVTLDDFERQAIATTLEQCGGVQRTAASRLGIERSTLSRKMKKYGL